MIARLVALTDSIRPTVRRVTLTAAAIARTKIKTSTSAKARYILRTTWVRSVTSRPTRSGEPSGAVSKAARTKDRSVVSEPDSVASKLARPASPESAAGHFLRLPARGARDASGGRGVPGAGG